MSRQSVGVGLIGCGTVGGSVARLLSQQARLYEQRLAGVSIQLRRVLVRDPAKHRASNVVRPELLTADTDAFFATDDMPIVIETAGGGEAVAACFRRALTLGKHVVTANKSLLAAEGPELFALARKNGAAIAFEASCGGGIPIVTALQFGLMANRVNAIYGILNGTSNYILTAMAQHGTSYAHALGEAQARGFAEADPTLDVSGHDSAQKLAVLSALAFGGRIDASAVACQGIDRLDLSDIRFGAELGYDIKLLAMGQRVGDDETADSLSLDTAPCFIRADNPLAQVHGSFNALLVCANAVGQTMYYGPGAGGLPTASAVISDLLNVAAGWYPVAFAAMNLWPDRQNPLVVLNADEKISRFYLRIEAKDTSGVMARVSAILGHAKISLSAVLQHEPGTGSFVPVVIITHGARQGAIHAALEQIEKLDEITGQPVCIRIADLPSD